LRMMPGHEQNYFTSREHRIFELMIKQFGNLKGIYSLCNKPLESVA